MTLARSTMRWTRRAWLWMLVGATACARATTEGGPIVRELDIRNTEAVSEGTLERRILTAETGWWPFADRQRFDPTVWQADLERIERVYETRGYYDARITRSEVLPEGEDGVRLIVEVEEGDPVRTGAVEVQGLEPLPPPVRDGVLDAVTLRRGTIFREGAWQTSKARALRALRDRGHAGAELVGEALVDVGTHEVTARLFARPGPVYHFGEIDVTGARGGIDPAWVREQVRLAVGRDRLFSEEALEEAQRRVFAMGVFASARVGAGALDPDAGRVPITVEVRQAPPRTLRLGGGVAFDQIRQEGRLVGDWTHRNFLGGLRRLSLQAMAGWAFIPSTFAVARNRAADGARHGPIYRAGAELEQARLAGRPSLRLRTLVESERTLEETYDALGGRLVVSVPWQPWSTVTIAPGYNLQGYSLRGPAAITAQSAPLALGCREDPCFVLLSFLEQIATWDRRDDPLEPRQGHFLTLSLQEGGGPLGGDFRYLRIAPEARGYWTFGEEGGLTVAGKLRVGTLLTGSSDAEESPVTARFYSGGAQWMRGFAVRRLSPLLLVPAEGGASDQRLTLPIGGNGLVEGSVEARVPAGESLTFAVFTDFGSVTPQRLGAANPLWLNWALGAGLRYRTPIGPVRLDVAVRLPFGRPPPLFDLDGTEITYRRLPGGGVEPGRETGGNVDTSCFGIGGSSRSTWVRDGLCAFHLSIGEAF